MASFLGNWGPKIFDADALTKIFIENAVAKALDPSRFSGEARIIRIRHILLNAWKGIGITSVLHADDVLTRTLAFFDNIRTAHATGPADALVSDPASDAADQPRQTVAQYQKMSAIDLLFGIIKDKAIDRQNNEDRAVLGRCLEYIVYYRANTVSSHARLTLALLKLHTIDDLNELGHYSGWDVIMHAVLPLLEEKRIKLEDPFFAGLVRDIIVAGIDYMVSPEKYASESQTRLLAFVPQLEAMPTDPKAKNLLNNISNVVAYGVCVDNDELMESTLNRVIQSIKDQVGGKGLFIAAAKNLFSTKNILAMSTATFAEYSCYNSRVLPGPVKWIGYSMYPKLFFLTRQALANVEDLFSFKTAEL